MLIDASGRRYVVRSAYTHRDGLTYAEDVSFGLTEIPEGCDAAAFGRDFHARPSFTHATASTAITASAQGDGAGE